MESVCMTRKYGQSMGYNLLSNPFVTPCPKYTNWYDLCAAFKYYSLRIQYMRDAQHQMGRET